MSEDEITITHSGEGVANIYQHGSLSASTPLGTWTTGRPMSDGTAYVRIAPVDMGQIQAIVRSEIEKALGRSVFVLLSLAQVRDELATRREQSDIDRVLVWVNEAIEELADTPDKDIRTLVAQEVRKALSEERDA